MKNFQQEDQELLHKESGILTAQLQRRSFLQYAGAGAAGIALIAAGCKKDDGSEGLRTDGVNLGSGDVGILNYAYALEQLEAAFYDAVVKTPYSGITAAELSLLTDIRDHELAHREFFKKALATNAIIGLEVDFSSINFTQRASVLATAKAFEDLGVSAYNGAGKLIKSVDYLVLAGKIVSVEARHAALIRDLIENGTFANSEVVDANGLDKARTPSEVLTIASGFIKTKINASNLPS
ncbi:Ferritin-like domain-containing protein [Pedobacter westerhofensis]|uniref:Ferritin-like domain-containing protein n=1 Tax=Pedobacter westerhofensis TaxID=425512 RepID=A0A521ARA4_9SPHI|nr:ferritin-like domain-containing protein [Pedobacter westerhofensis]SMO37180.1 Ferritin-like domain-containing protein [Pedobacter westerhofensis]